MEEKLDYYPTFCRRRWFPHTIDLLSFCYIFRHTSNKENSQRACFDLANV